MQLVKNIRLIKCVLFVIALQVLNMSIDAPAAQTNTASGDFNFIDTYVEYVAEVVLKYQDAIPESKHRQQKELQLHKHVQVICQTIQWVQVSLPPNVAKNIYLVYQDKPGYPFVKEINPPPPKFS